MRVLIITICLTVFFGVGPIMAQSPWLAPYGDASCGSNFVPTFHTGGEMPVLGNAGFRLVSENLIGGTPGFILLSITPANLPFLGMTLYADPTLGIWVAYQVGGTGGAGSGTMDLPLQIPNNAALVGGKLFIQGFFFDVSVTSSSLVHTHGLGMTIAPFISPDVAVIRDRLKYQAYFTGATQAQADQLGRAIWAANQVAGFTYIKTEQFTCGGQSHWVVIVSHAQTGMEFCLIPGGSFRMGDINGTGGSEELPVHRVRVAPFLLARTEVTQASFTAVMGTSPWVGQLFVMSGPDYAANYISWYDTSAFCAKAGFRLLAEAEWEYACRAGTETCYHFGENYPPASLGNYAWYDANAFLANPPEQYPHQVGQKMPNSFGLFDMHGNVCEWCEDNWRSNYQCAPSDGRVWTKGLSGLLIRGGGWSINSTSCRSTTRARLDRSTRYFYLGFRPARSLP